MSKTSIARAVKPNGECARDDYKHYLYNTWKGMLGRCNKENDPSYKNYGGRGIRVCESWHYFKEFAADVGDRPLGTTLDRIDVNGNYEPGNIRWSTASEQAYNRRKDLKRILRHPRTRRRDSKTGVVGVSLATRIDRPWRSRITHKGRDKTRFFDTFEEAVEFRKSMEKSIFSDL